MQAQFQMSWKINKENKGLLIKDFLKTEEISRTALTDIKFKGGKILINDQEVNVRYRLNDGDILRIIFPTETPSEGVKAEKIPLNILFEDDYLLVVNKPPGMSTIPSREHPNGSLANALVGYYKEIGIGATSHIVTRLDRDTSGLVLIAKHRHVHHLLSLQQRNGSVKRTYEALAAGTIKSAMGLIKQPIGRKETSIIERVVRPDGQYACTHFKVINQYNNFTHVELKLDTGRTHQIRVHMAYIGHPLLGDDLYGGDISLITRQALHCKSLEFLHPFSKQGLNFSTPLPVDMKQIIKAVPL